MDCNRICMGVYITIWEKVSKHILTHAKLFYWNLLIKPNSGLPMKWMSEPKKIKRQKLFCNKDFGFNSELAVQRKRRFSTL